MCLIAGTLDVVVEVAVFGYGFDNDVVGAQIVPIGGSQRAGACACADIKIGYCAGVVSFRLFKEVVDLSIHEQSVEAQLKRRGEAYGQWLVRSQSFVGAGYNLGDGWV